MKTLRMAVTAATLALWEMAALAAQDLDSDQDCQVRFGSLTAVLIDTPCDWSSEASQDQARLAKLLQDLSRLQPGVRATLRFSPKRLTLGDPILFNIQLSPAGQRSELQIVFQQILASLGGPTVNTVHDIELDILPMIAQAAEEQTTLDRSTLLERVLMSLFSQPRQLKGVIASQIPEIADYLKRKAISCGGRLERKAS